VRSRHRCLWARRERTRQCDKIKRKNNCTQLNLGYLWYLVSKQLAGSILCSLDCEVQVPSNCPESGHSTPLVFRRGEYITAAAWHPCRQHTRVQLRRKRVVLLEVLQALVHIPARELVVQLRVHTQYAPHNCAVDLRACAVQQCEHTEEHIQWVLEQLTDLQSERHLITCASIMLNCNTFEHVTTFC